MIASPILLAATAIWHGLAFWHFTLFPERTLARTTRERPVSPIAREILRFLGAINAAFSVLGLAAIVCAEARQVAYAVLAVANLSQFLVDLRVRRTDLVKGPMFTQILIGDGLFTLLNTGALVLAVALNR